MNYPVKNSVDRKKRQGTVLLVAFWCLMALSFSVFALHEQCLLDYHVMARQVEKEQAYWVAIGGGQRVASYLISLSEPSSVLDSPAGPEWFGRNGRVPGPLDPANLGGVYFKVCKKAFTTNEADYNIEDEAGRININNCPSKEVTEEYLNSGGKPSGVLVKLLKTVSDNLNVSRVSDPEGAAAVIVAQKRDRVNRQKDPDSSGQGNSRRAGQETFVAEDVFRHPYDILVNTGLSSQWLFGEDVNRNALLDPSEDDSGSLKTWPDDDGDSTLDVGIVDKITTFSDGRFNIYTSDEETLSIMLCDFIEIFDLVKDARNRGEKPNPNSFIQTAYPDKSNQKRRWFRAFRSEYLTQTERTDYFRITVQAYLRDGSWGGCIEQVFKLERESSGSGSSRPGGKYFRPLFKQFR